MSYLLPNGSDELEKEELQSRLVQMQTEFGRRSEEFGRQNEELGRQNEEFGRQNEELGRQNEELGRQNEELQNNERIVEEKLRRSGEELLRKDEELKRKDEELQRKNQELRHKEEEWRQKEERLVRDFGGITAELEGLKFKLSDEKLSHEEQIAKMQGEMRDLNAQLEGEQVARKTVGDEESRLDALAVELKETKILLEELKTVETDMNRVTRENLEAKEKAEAQAREHESTLKEAKRREKAGLDAGRKSLDEILEFVRELEMPNYDEEEKGGGKEQGLGADDGFSTPGPPQSAANSDFKTPYPITSPSPGTFSALQTPGRPSSQKRLSVRFSEWRDPENADFDEENLEFGFEKLGEEEDLDPSYLERGEEDDDLDSMSDDDEPYSVLTSAPAALSASKSSLEDMEDWGDDDKE